MAHSPSRPLVSARDVDRLPRGATLRVSPRAIITPWARDRAAIRGITIEACDAHPDATASPPSPAPAAAAGACGCGACCAASGAVPRPAEAAMSPAAAAARPAAWISPFSNRILRGPDVSVLLGAVASSSPSGY